MAFSMLALLFFLASAMAAEFLYPPAASTESASNLTYHLGDAINATWTSTYTNPELIMWCGLNDTLVKLADDYGTLSKSGFTLVKLPTNINDTSDNCHLELKAHTATSGIKSENFKVHEKINATNPAKTWGLISPTATASGTTASTGSATASSGSIPSTSGSSGLSSGAIAGIAVGCVVAVIFLISTAATLIFRRRKAARKAPEYKGGEDDQTSWRHELLGSAQGAGHSQEKDVQVVAPATQEKFGQPVVPMQEMDGRPVVPVQELEGSH